MKKVILFLLFIWSTHAMGQNTFPGTGNVGIGTTSPTEIFSILGYHGVPKIGLHADLGNPSYNADLLIWASEPGWSYSGTGIGNNVINNVGITRLNTGRGASYIRLLDQEIRLNIIKTTGEDLSAITINPNGFVGINTLSPKEALSVNGNIRAKEVKVETANWPDYVFDKGYKITSLSDLEDYIKINGHLPEMPDAKEAEKNGIALGDMNKLLLKKVEELTLHLIEKEKTLNDVLKRLEKIENQTNK